jgi:hypothetical protein
MKVAVLREFDEENWRKADYFRGAIIELLEIYSEIVASA